MRKFFIRLRALRATRAKTRSIQNGDSNDRSLRASHAPMTLDKGNIDFIVKIIRPYFDLKEINPLSIR
jgi:hypothetical protein